MHKRGYSRHAVSVCVCVCVSVCLSRSWIMWKRINISSKFFSPLGSHTILVFPYQTGWRYSDGNPPNGGVKCRWGIGTNRVSGVIAGYQRLLDVRSAKNIYRRRSCVYDTVDHAPVAIDQLLDSRTTKWQKQLPRTMQCRSHSRRRTSECLFVTACSMDEYADEKRTEQNLMVRSGITKAKTTSNTRSSVAAERLRDASCLSLVSFNIPTAQFFITIYCGFRFDSASNSIKFCSAVSYCLRRCLTKTPRTNTPRS